MEIITGSRRTPLTWALTVTFVSLGIYLRQPVLSGICLLLALMPFALSKGLEVDLPNSRLRHFTKIGGLRIGEWEELPPVSRVVVKYFSQLGTSGRPGRMRTDQEAFWVVMLSVAGSANGIVVERLALTAKADALQLAATLAKPLGVPVVFIHPQEAPHGVTV
ncbi:hypothetical protein EJV47_17495 [Hymenobacter gummosus]|uniref:Uncharacterized protein n=1 Tax=Hymenobacter gummosus TaxID=1776032 RepID=A0A3S0H3R6_9BACT|nr:hypothetical protein [Hymenobacter gummosus]RTQ48222.1 hypothetical protein EJV47_17495 [Hymenobacter gummosus]